MLVDDDTKTISEKYVASPLLCRSHDYFEVLSDSSSGVVEPVTLDRQNSACRWPRYLTALLNTAEKINVFISAAET